jgi:hypothetical protein
MAQMPLFHGIGGRPFWATLLPCSRAALFDVAVTIAVAILFMALVRRHPTSVWPWIGMLATGAIVASVIESAGIGGGRWAYAPAMPILPEVRLGVVPVLQMALVPPLSAWLTLRPRRGPMKKARHGSGV